MAEKKAKVTFGEGTGDHIFIWGVSEYVAGLKRYGYECEVQPITLTMRPQTLSVQDDFDRMLDELRRKGAKVEIIHE